MNYKGYIGVVDVDEKGTLHGEVINSHPAIPFAGTTGEELRQNFIKSVDQYLETQDAGKDDFIYDKAYFAESGKLESCLKDQGNKPLKLIVESLWKGHPRFEEIPWVESEWNYISTDDQRIQKPVLLNGRDLFQFSIANENSNQDRHYHEHVFEIYVSNYPMSVVFETPTTLESEQYLEVKDGILIMPPGISHKVTLTGTTFVFQATLAGKNLNGDKIKLL
jgi:hypothetical protein